MISPLKILILLNRVPFPLNDGGAIGAYQFVKGYADAKMEVHCLAMNTYKHFLAEETIREKFSFAQKFETVPIDNRIKILPALFNLFSDESYIISRFRSKKYNDKLIALLQQNQYDVVHIDGLPPGLYIDTIRAYSNALIAQRAHNVEYRIWQRGAAEATNLIKKLYLNIQAKRLQKFETQSLSKVDVVLSISTEDDEAIKQLNKAIHTYIIPAGIAVDEKIDITLPEEFSLAFIGSFDWLPNIQGLDWFIANCWDEILVAFPTIKFFIAGKKMPERYRSIGKNIVAVGEVPDAKKFMQSHSVLLVPLVSGSGVRIKIIEAFAIGKTVLATTIAAEGSGATPEKEILIADTTAQFIQKINECISDKNKLIAIGTNAHTFALENYQNKNIMQRLISFYYQKINSK